MDEADALEALSNVLNRLTENPYDIALHAENVRLAYSTGMEDQIDSALDMVTAFWMAGDEVWMPIIDRKQSTSNLESAQDLKAILNLYERAEQDYLSIPLLQRHLELLIDRYQHFASSESRNLDLGELFSTEWTRGAIHEMVSKGLGHLTQSHLLWDLQKDWELEVLQDSPSTESAALVNHVESMLLERLQQPHSNHDETFQAYSTFTTNYKPPDQYESLLVKASKLRSQAVKVYEKREAFESSLAQMGFSLQAYAYYIAAERRKKPDLFVLKTVYERAIAEAQKRRWAGESSAEDALRSFWTGYVDFLRMQDVGVDLQITTFKRALRSVPASGEVWARHMRFMERMADSVDAEPEVSAAYEKTKSIGPLQSEVEQLVPVILARAGYEKRQIEAGKSGEDGFNILVEVLMDGINRVRKASPSGDPRLRIEKYFSVICLKLAGLLEHALILWEDATKHYKTSYLAWTSYTEILIKQNLYDDARKVFRDISMKNLDWPEAIWDAWLNFEQLYGSVEDIEDCLDRIERAQQQISARRAKEAEKAQYAAGQVAAEQQAVAISAEEVSPPTRRQTDAAPTSMDVDSNQPGEGSAKRKAEDDILPDESKRPKMDQKSAPLKRDRENCTVFVADLPAGAQEDDLAALFKDCGIIREVKMTQLPNALVATVEFMERDSVLAALTKDKKRVGGEEIAVHLAWQSTLYVTNFPEKADDTYIRNLFTKYGTIFDVRWPSKKFKSTRRFCYVQFTSPPSAQAALELHGQELQPGQSLSVLISNPERRKERTDSDANDREIYVAGLSRFVTKEDLETLFRTYGIVKDIRIALDKDDRPKGFAFIEFEQEKDAVAALAANNYDLKGRRMAVTLADTRFRTKNRESGHRANVRNRSLRIRNLPPGTQEGLLHQTLEKSASVKRVEVFADKDEALVELENAADVGKLLLLAQPIVFNGNALELSAEDLGGSSVSRPATVPPATGGGLFVPRAAASRPRAGLGSKKRVTAVLPVSSTSQSPLNSSQGKGQDDFRKMLGGSGH
ncbi:hypothetical protein AcW1_007863 [Taiwanofungus camphoratus]|nr:hypothetical protein AcW2_007079 [Antrodia cinnamomea]KAI0923280.1 hypothetical protein AcV7_005835 [Antrodia cinnamomea]KAI0926689.1 hypothetical protein AcV5_007414 [Antrodia cinnamomea]KAI0953713.1 hypothetical protein AcW1_007863 [Antrodia cinnamomea]